VRLKAFLGIWRLDRAIEDAHGGRTGRFTGQARFTPISDGFEYFEEGEFRLEGTPPLAASRRYLWREAQGGAIDVFFAGGGFFHRFDALDARPSALHDCPPDRYEVRYDFRAWPRWTAEWRVRGPRKDYRSLSAFRRLDSSLGFGQEHS
jgi:Family of unknown function (DUF6314)